MYAVAQYGGVPKVAAERSGKNRWLKPSPQTRRTQKYFSEVKWHIRRGTQVAEGDGLLNH